MIQAFYGTKLKVAKAEMLPNHRLLALAFHRVPSRLASSATSSSTTTTLHQSFSSSSRAEKWEGSKPSNHATNSGNDPPNVQHKAAQEGQKERAQATGTAREGSAATSRKGGEENAQAKRDHPEAPGPVLGMNDERGGVRTLECRESILQA